MLPENAAGAAVMGEMPWGTHFCYFYETKQDLLETSVSFLQAGLEAGAFCLWIVYSPINDSDAGHALTQTIPGADRYLAQGGLELFIHPEPDGELPDPREMIRFLHEKLDAALAQGYTGMRVAGSPSCLQKTDLRNFREFEQELAKSISARPMIALCTFPLAASSAAEILDAARTHQFVLAKRSGDWEIIETPEPKLTKAQLAKLNHQLEQRVQERTKELEGANEKLRAEIARRQEVEADLRRQKEILQTVFDHAPVAINFLDKTGHVQMVNPEWERMVGYSADEIVNQGVDVIAEGYPDPVQQQRARDFIASPNADWADFEARTKSGGTVHSTWSVVRLSDGSRIGIGQDITQRKRAEQDLRQQKEVLQTIFDNIPVMITFFDQDQRVQLANREFERTIGWSLEEIQRHDLDILSLVCPAPDYREEVRKFMTLNGEWRDLKLTVRGGRVIDTSWMVLHLPNGTGLGIGQDITERKRAEQALRESEELFRQLAENINDLFWIKTADLKRVIYMSPIYKRITGRTPEETYSDTDYRRFLDKIVPEDREIMAGIIRRGAGEEFDVEYRVIGIDGKIHWVHERGFPVRDQSGRVYRMAGIARNVTGRKRAEEHLKDSSEHLRALSASLHSAREKEAARIARQIHDDVGGFLTSLRWELEELQKMVQQPACASSSDAIHQKLTGMVGLTDTTIDVVRRVASELRPSILDDLGLLEAIEWQAQQFQARTRIQCRLDCPMQNPPLDNQQSTAVFRIVQEALTNVLRHAHATQVDITIRDQAGILLLTVKDNGRGITPAEKANRNSLGLLGMQERAHLIGADLDINGELGSGTVLSLRIPVSEQPIAGETY